MVRFFPKSEFLDVIFFPKMKPVIGPEDDDGVFCNGTMIERIE